MRPFSEFFRTRTVNQPSSGLVREEQTAFHHIRVDLTSQVISLDIDKDVRAWRSDVPIPSLSVMLSPQGRTAWNLDFTSAAMLGQKAKQFDDGLVAAIALGFQEGLPTIGSKPDFLKRLLTELLQVGPSTHSGILPVLMAAAQLGGASFKIPVEWQPQVDQVLGRFLNDSYRSKPLGFYTWSEALTNIFRQDRLLQTPISAGDAALLAAFLQSQPDLRTRYEKLLMLGERLTNYYALADLRKPASSDHVDGSGSTAIFPPCASPEVSLLERLYPPPKSLPDGFSLINEVIRCLRSGELSLAPRAHSGWYEYQLWSLEPLVVPEQTPEAAHLRYEDLYKKHLTELFKGMYALARETYVKDLRLGMTQKFIRSESLPISVSPHLTVEPVPTSYRRRALGYRFLHDSLREIVGEDALSRLRRAREGGPVNITLSEELTQVEALFWGAYLVGMHELGFPATVEPASGDTCALSDDFCWQHFKNWQDRLVDDEDLTQDCRMMVPVFYDFTRKQMKVWAFLGWRESWIKTSFVQNPKVEVVSFNSEHSTGEVRFVPRSYRAVHPVMHEVYVSELLNRDEFRAHCDEHKTEEAILKNLPGVPHETQAQT